MLENFVPIRRSGLLVAGGATMLISMAVLNGCTNKAAPAQPPAPTSGPYVKVVVIGDSLSSGFQNDSLLDSQQPNGFASLIAAQAKFPMQLPLIAPVGAPAVLQLLSAGTPPVIAPEAGTTTGRDNIDIQPNDLAVPGQTLNQLINLQPMLNPATNVEILTDLVLGAPIGNQLSQLGETIVLAPTTVFLWIGANDALQADEAGTPTAMTSLSSFTSDYTALIKSLKTNTHAHLMVANIPDFTMIPFMTQGSVILREAAAVTGLSTAVVSAELGVKSADLLNSQGLSDFETELAAYAKKKTLSALPGSDVLTAAEIITTQNTITSYNKVIAKQVSAAGGTLIDLHTYYAAIGAGITINGYKATRGFLGGLFSLDGVHPTNTAYALIANQYIAATNKAFGLAVPAVNVSEVAAKDPYFGLNVSPTARIPAAAATQASRLMKPRASTE